MYGAERYLFSQYKLARSIVSFDFETLGVVIPKFQPVGLGITVLRDDELANKYLIKGYKPGMKMEKRCDVQFWRKEPHVLKALTVEESRYNQTDDALCMDMLRAFFRVVRLEQLWAEKNGTRVEIVTDNCSFDVVIMNELIGRYGSHVRQFVSFPSYDSCLQEYVNTLEKLPNETREEDGDLFIYPLPYLWGSDPHQFGQIVDITQFIAGLLASERWGMRSGYWSSVREIWSLPNDLSGFKGTAHMPDDDSQYIAEKWKILRKIKSGKIRKRFLIVRIVRHCLHLYREWKVKKSK